MGGVNAFLTFTFPIKQNQDINTSIQKTIQTLITMFDPNTGQNLDIDVSLAHPWSQDIIRRSSKENGHAAVTREDKKMKKIYRRACSRRICIKMCSSCDRTFWEVGHKGSEFFAAFVTTVSKSRSQF